MPKTTIDENRYLASWPCEIGLPGNGPMFTITEKAGGTKEFSKCYFGGPVASRSNRGHDLGTYFFADVIHDNSDGVLSQRAE